MFDACLSEWITPREWLRRFVKYKNKYGLRTAWAWMVWSLDTNGGGIMLCIPVGYNTAPAWTKYTLKPILEVLLWFRHVKYEFYYRFVKKYRYNVVYTDLEPGCYDKDHVMLHACFTLLVDFVEKESGGETSLAMWTSNLADEKNHGERPNGAYNPPELMTSQANNQSEILNLYRWWKYQRPLDEAERTRLLMSVYGHDPVEEGIEERDKQFRALEKKIEDDEQVMLHRLVDIRRTLWT